MRKVLWLCSWYPNKLSPFEGDFIQRHAQAASLYNHIHVIKLTPGSQESGVLYDTRSGPEYPDLTETRIYYSKSPGRAGQLLSYYKWLRLYKNAVQNYIAQNGKPDLIHVHIPFKAGQMALWAKKKWGIPYVVTEHWGGYNDVVAGNYRQRPLWFRKIIFKTLEAASGVHSVSDYLGRQLNKVVLPVTYIVIPNAVNTTSFTAGPAPAEERFRLLHISTGAAVKNVPGIINAFLKLNPLVYSLKILGLTQELKGRYSREFPGILFETAIPYEQVAAEIRKADALVVFSHMENSPCVIGEAHCCGVPVIAANVGGIPELIDHTNGILITAGDEAGLVAAIKEMKTHYHYQSGQIAEKAAARYSYKKIGEELNAWYQQLLK